MARSPPEGNRPRPARSRRRRGLPPACGLRTKGNRATAQAGQGKKLPRAKLARSRGRRNSGRTKSGPGPRNGSAVKGSRRPETAPRRPGQEQTPAKQTAKGRRHGKGKRRRRQRHGLKKPGKSSARPGLSWTHRSRPKSPVSPAGWPEAPAPEHGFTPITKYMKWSMKMWAWKEPTNPSLWPREVSARCPDLPKGGGVPATPEAW